jgi:KaiC/GvpD/RAD55 family RecA-like ATPase
LIPDLIDAPGCYMLYGKAGIGKTTMTLALARTITGDPGHRQFLDFEVPASAWGNRRVLLIASDGDDEAAADLKRYSKWHRMDKTQWQRQYLRVIAAERAANIRPWQMKLPDLHRLLEILKEAQEAGTPYCMVIFDSLKSICPDGVRVGDQVMREYLHLLRNLCFSFEASALFIHHQSKDGDHSQGIAALEEITSGNFQLRVSDTGQRMFVIKKSRAAMHKRTEIPFLIEGGAITVEESDQVDFSRGLLNALQKHEEEWIHAMRLDGRTTVGYPGVSLSRLPKLIEKHCDFYTDQSGRAWQDLARRLLTEGALIRVGTGSSSGIRIAGGVSGYESSPSGQIDF